MLLVLSFLCGALSILLISAAMKIKNLEKQISDIRSDIAVLGESFQKCFDTIVEQVNSHSVELSKHQKAIEYLTKEFGDD